MAFPMRSNVIKYAGGGTSSLIRGFQTAEAQARAANIAREKEVRDIYDRMIARAGPGGAFEKAGLAEIETARVKGTGQEMQQLISSGMYGTTTAAGIPSRWESEVGAPARLKLEDIMEQRLSATEQAKAGFVERIQDTYPDYGPLMQAVQAASAVGGGGGDTYGQYDPNWFEKLGGGIRSGGGYTRPDTSYTGGVATQPTAAKAAPAFRQGTQYSEEGIKYAGLGPSVLGDKPTTQPIGGKQLTSAEQFTVQERLKAMYPQMYKPGWGKTTAPTKTPAKKTSWWSKIGTAFGGGV